MEEHARAVVARWAKKMPAAVADGMSEEDFLRNFKRFLLWGGWNVEIAEKMVTKVRQMNERRKQNENKAESFSD